MDMYFYDCKSNKWLSSIDFTKVPGAPVARSAASFILSTNTSQ
jgi:hypothetical protein